MAKHSMPEMKEGGVNVTPLIDVVMCLIIFFMLVAKIGVDNGADKKIELPETIIGVKIDKLGGTLILNVSDPNIEIDDATKKPKRINDKVKRMVNSHLDPIVTAQTDPKNPIAKEVKLEVVNSAGQLIDEPLVRVLKEALRHNRDFSVTIRAQKEIEFKNLQRVLLAVAKSGVTKINFGAAGKKA